MVKISPKRTFLFFTILIITVSGSDFMVNNGKQSLLEYLGYGLLLSGIVIHFLRMPRHYRQKYINYPAIILCVLFSVGLLQQELTWVTKIILLCTMAAIVFVSLLAEGFIDSVKEIRILSYGVLAGCFVSMCLALISGHSMVSTSEGILGFNIAFDGGIQYKNYFGANMIAVFMGLYIYTRQTRKRLIRDRAVMTVCIILIFLSGSRGAYLIFLTFLLSFNYDFFKKIHNRQRKLLICIMVVTGAFAFVYLYDNIALNSSTYMYRVRGLLNYLEYFTGDWFHMIFGNAEMAYENKLNYVMSVRSVVGWDGSLEFAWLDVIIKNGFFGVVGYLVIFIRALKISFKSEQWGIKTACIAVTLALLLSSLVETYMQSIHAVFGVYSYLVIAALCGMMHKSNAGFVRCCEPSQSDRECVKSAKNFICM